jgi:predicted MFS family arabinose efflux permease
VSVSARIRAKIRLNLIDTFAAMRHTNYRIYSGGQFVSSIGGWMQNTAQGYLIYQLTQSTAYLGYVSFAWGIPIWLFSLYGGVVADRVSRRTMLIVTNSVLMSLSLVISLLIFTQVIQPWHILVTAFISGVANAFDGPSRNGFVVELVGREDLSNAIALNATIFHLATVMGPAVGGVAYAILGPGWCFAANATAFMAMIFALWRIQVPMHALRIRAASAMTELREGIQYALGNPAIRVLLINLAVYAFFGFSLMTLIPAWAVDVLGGDVRFNGLLLSARGVGSLIGALMLASYGRRGVRGRFLNLATFILPVATIVFAQLRWIPMTLVLAAFMGWGMLIWGNVTNAMMQTETPDELRGRVMGLFVLVLFGGQPLGALVVGNMADHLGAPLSATIFSVVILAAAVITWFRAPFLRKIA